MESYKAVIEGTSGDQVVTNTVYYVDKTSGLAPFDPPTMFDLADAIKTDLIPVLMTGVSDTYTCVQVTVSCIDGTHTVTSPYEIVVSTPDAGEVAGATPSKGAVAIYGFRVGPFASDPAPRVPKRGYIALGPLSIAHIGLDGTYLASNTIKNNIVIALIGDVEGTLGIYSPVRVGRPNASNVPSWGRAVGAIARGNTSTRKSRTRRPSG